MEIKEQNGKLTVKLILMLNRLKTLSKTQELKDVPGYKDYKHQENDTVVLVHLHIHIL